MRERNIKYDVLRIVAMFCIMFYHYTTRYNELYGHNNIRFMVPAEVATVSVSLFFIMVGYFSFYSLENTNGAFTYVKKKNIEANTNLLGCVHYYYIGINYKWL